MSGRELVERTCLCGSESQPERVVRGALSLLLCRRCGRPTVERKRPPLKLIDNTNNPARKRRSK